MPANFTGSLAISGSLIISGSILTSGSITISGSIASASYAEFLGGLPSSSFASASVFNQVSASFSSTSGSIAGRVNIIETSYATTGSNNFTRPQQISDVSNAISFTSTASLYTAGGLRVSKDSFVSGTAYFNNVVVYGTSSIQYITSSQVNIGTNIITVNTDTPAVRFGGLAVFDSGSTQLTGSLLWDSEANHWIYSNPSGSTYSGGMLISGPRAASLGTEVGTTACAVMIGQGGDHITSSGIFSYGNATCFYGTSYVSGSGAICTSNTIIGTTIYGATAICGGSVTGTCAVLSGNGLFGGSTNAGNAGTNTVSVGVPGSVAGGLQLWAATNQTHFIQFGDGTASADNYRGYISYAHGTDTLSLGTTSTDRLTISSTGAATFSSSVTAGSNIILPSGFELSYGNGNVSILGNTSTNTMELRTNNSTKLTISSTGAATFSNALQVAGQQAAANYGGTGLNFDFTTANIGRIASVKTTSGGSQLQFIVYNTSGTDINTLSIASTGAATFSSSVTTGNYVLATNTLNSVDGSFLIDHPGINTWKIGVTNTNTSTFHIGNDNGGSFVTKVLNITNAGNVGIGTSTPGQNLTVYSDTNGDARLSLNNPNAGASARTFLYAITTGNRYTGILTYGSGATGTTAGLSNASLGILEAGGDTSALLINSGGASSPMVFATNATERMRITGSGKAELLIGTQTATWSASNRALLELNGASSGTALLGLKINDSQRAYFYHNNTNLYIEQMVNPGSIYVISFSNGVYLTAGATSWTANSDERLKDITGNIENAVDSLLTLRTVKHTWKSDDTKKEHLALIAQDVEKVFPQVIDKNKLPSKANEEQTDNTEYLGVRYTELVPVLVKAIQELKAENDALKLRIENLESK